MFKGQKLSPLLEGVFASRLNVKMCLSLLLKWLLLAILSHSY